MRKHRLYLAFTLACLLPGCAQPYSQPRPEPGPGIVIALPQTRQAKDYTCGVAVAQSLLAYNGFLYRQDVLEKKVEASPEWGTDYRKMADCLAEHGVAAELVENMTLADVRNFVDAGKPIICFLQAWHGSEGFDYTNAWEDGHYAVAIGYDADRVYFMDPSTLANYAFIPNRDFLSRWHDGDGDDPARQFHHTGLVITNPSRKYNKNAVLPML